MSESGGYTGEPNINDTSDNNEVPEDADQADENVVIIQKLPKH